MARELHQCERVLDRGEPSGEHELTTEAASRQVTEKCSGRSRSPINMYSLSSSVCVVFQLSF